MIGYGNSMFLATHGILARSGPTGPINTVAPAITGTAVDEYTLTCSTGTWTGTAPITYAYQWTRNGSNIGSATNSTYTLVTADVGQSILCVVTATDISGNASANSNTVIPISNAQYFINQAGITDPTQQSAINTLVTDLKGYNIWTKFKAIYPIVGGSSSSHAVNLKTPGTFNLSFQTGWTHASTGMTPNGATYANTALIENTSLNSDDSHLSIYSRTNAIGLYCDIGADNGTTQSNIFPNYSNSFYPRIQAVNGGTAVSLNTQGLFLANRVNSTQVQGWRNTTKYTISSNSTGKVTTFPFWLGAMNVSNNPLGTNSIRQLAFASIGDGLTDTQATNFYTAVQAYQTTLSRQV